MTEHREILPLMKVIFVLLTLCSIALADPKNAALWKHNCVWQKDHDGITYAEYANRNHTAWLWPCKVYKDDRYNQPLPKSNYDKSR